jgi:hypothetical protein
MEKGDQKRMPVSISSRHRFNRRLSSGCKVLPVMSLVTLLLCCASPHVAGAKALGWYTRNGIETRPLNSGESEQLSEDAITKKNYTFQQSEGKDIGIECTQLRFYLASYLTGPKGIKFSPLYFEHCHVTEPFGSEGCEVSSTGYPNGLIRTQALGFITAKALEGTAGTPLIKIPPESSTEEITTVHLGGTMCPTEQDGSYTIKGKLTGLVDTSELRKAHTWEFTKTSGTKLSIGGVAASFTGAGEFTLKSGYYWGIYAELGE